MMVDDEKFARSIAGEYAPGPSRAQTLLRKTRCSLQVFSSSLAATSARCLHIFSAAASAMLAHRASVSSLVPSASALHDDIASPVISLHALSAAFAGTLPAPIKARVAARLRKSAHK